MFHGAQMTRILCARVLFSKIDTKNPMHALYHFLHIMTLDPHPQSTNSLLTISVVTKQVPETEITKITL